MPVKLLPPVNQGGGMHQPGDKPLEEAHRYVRGRDNSRWHRPRSGTVHADWTSVSYWCGPGARLDRLIGRDDAPTDLPVCGTCEGRALGALVDETPDGMPSLLFSPRTLRPPRWCPGSRAQRLVVLVGERGRVGTCRVCGEMEAVRALGRGYHAYGYGLAQHTPGAGLVAPCPWHAWQRMEPVGESSAACGCGYRPEVAP